jgi:hypothetical protein
MNDTLITIMLFCATAFALTFCAFMILFLCLLIIEMIKDNFYD